MLMSDSRRQLSRLPWLALASVLLALALPVAAGAQNAALPHDSVLVRPLTFRNIGPASMSGRIVDLSVVEAPRAVRGGRLGTVIYAAVATGGVWKSTNAGMTWTPMSDSIRIGSIGAVAAAPGNGDIVWLGTGEPNNMRSSSWGAGVFKSTDGGRTWSKPMLPKTQHIGRIVIDPRNPDVVYVAALGPLWAAGGDRGLFKTTDGGVTWTNTKNISAQTGFTELVMDPSNADVLYAASLQRERREYGFRPGGSESAIWKSVDAGGSWTKLGGGLPSGEIGRIGLAVCKSKPSTVYATVHAKGSANGFYRSDDAGATWRNVNGSNGTAWYYSQVRCDPTDPEHVYRLNASSQESTDGGKTWQSFAGNGGVHSDSHALWINPEAPEHLILGNDGGIDISHDKGRTWYNVENIVGAQFYSISVDDAKPFYNVFGGLQDNATWGGPNRTRNSFGPSNADWYRMAGGDGFYNVPDPTDHNIVYAESQGGVIVRYDTRTGQTKSIRPTAKPGETFRYNWSAPILPSRHTPGAVYFAANVVFKSLDRGDSWRTISPDLTRNIKRNDLPLRGSKPDTGALGLHEGTQEFSNITTLAESPLRAGLVAAGTDDGNIQVTRDDGKTWTNTTKFPGVPDTTYVSRVIFSQHAEGTLYATLDGHRSNDFQPYVVKSTDFGRTWTSITSDLPEGGSVQVIREHHRQPGLLFVGTEYGVFATTDGGKGWIQLKSGIPGVPVHDLHVQTTWNDLVIGTHGRGIYIMDDIAPLEHLAEAKQAKVAYLFPTRAEMNFPINNSRISGMGSTGFVGQNPDYGVRVAYLVHSIPADARAKLEILNSSGAVVRDLPVVRQPGLHRPLWDMRIGPPFTGPVDTSAAGRGGRGAGGGGLGGGFGGATTFPAIAGAYTARLTITPSSGAPTVLSQKITLLRDPQQSLTDAQLRMLDSARTRVVALQRTLQALQARTDSSVMRVAAMRRAADSNSTKLAPQAISELAAIEAAVREISRDVGTRTGGGGGRGGAARPPAMDDDPNPAPVGPTIQARAGTLNDMLSVTFGVSAAQQSLLTALNTELEVQRAKLAKLESERIPGLGSTMRAAGVTLPLR
ncbi:MAG TPA: hypothetical protein VE869_09735 [Gemmatimonas sp.]|nr:hypothetical protein [Gemmatimonas sp.]